MASNRPQINFRLSEEDRDRLDRMAADMGTTPTAFAKSVVVNALHAPDFASAKKARAENARAAE